MEDPIWSPNEERIISSNMTKFTGFAAEKTGIKFVDYDDFYNWSTAHIDKFWELIWMYSGILYTKKYSEVMSEPKMPGTKWFRGAKLNFAENLLRYRDSRTAVISARESASLVRISYEELFRYAAACAENLKRLGVKKGDRVAGFITNVPEAIIAMLATTSIGAVWSSCSPDFGLKGVLDRFGQIKPKVLFAVESYQYNGRQIDCVEKIERILENIPEVEHTVYVERFFDFNIKPDDLETEFTANDKRLYFKDLLRGNSRQIDFEQLPFDHPVYIMYSSGTTGVPKCIVHGAGGTLLQHYKELALHTNLTREDVITYYTTCGWMMWNWLVSSLQIGAAIFLYDGNPAYPNLNILWEYIESERITVFGTSPKYLTSCQKAGLTPKDKFDLTALKTILSTGSPLSAENFQYVYSKIKDDLQLSSIAGGTDIISCFMLGNPNLPVYEGEIQCRGLGMKVEAFNESGQAVIDKKGELVCTAPFPSMPVYFWNDPDNKKYISAYFEYFPGVWRHGDYIKITGHGGVIIYGRSDATLNPGGVRIGTAEIYRIVEAMEEIADSIVVGQNWNNDVRIILFVSLKQGGELNDKLIEKIKHNIRSSATPRHVPAKIFEVKEIPRTISGKKVEMAVSRIIHGEEVENKDALANPEVLAQFAELATFLTK